MGSYEFGMMNSELKDARDVVGFAEKQASVSSVLLVKPLQFQTKVLSSRPVKPLQLLAFLQV